MSLADVNHLSQSKPEFVYKEQQANWQAAVARTLTRSLALYFSRPVRLFRPSKVSGWHSLRGLAAQHGTSLGLQYLSSLVKSQGFIVIPKHFIPPMLVNAMLGTILWETYANVHIALDPHLVNHIYLNAALSGGIAGGFQALVAAPAENARIILEGGSGGSSWSHAWKEVFQGTKSRSISRQADIEDIRQLRGWFKEVGDMAGRGWAGWGWGLGKDICGFAAFFSLFELTRYIAVRAKNIAQSMGAADRSARQLPRIIHGITLISGGVAAGLAYEAISIPWDTARKIVQLHKKAYEDGILSCISSHNGARYESQLQSASRSGWLNRRMYGLLRTLGRVGPWGVGFLVWEAYGPGLH